MLHVVRRTMPVGQPAPAAEVLGNIFDGKVKLYDRPLPCTHDVCPCGDLWEFITDGESDT